MENSTSDDTLELHEMTIEEIAHLLAVEDEREIPGRIEQHEMMLFVKTPLGLRRVTRLFVEIDENHIGTLEGTDGRQKN